MKRVGNDKMAQLAHHLDFYPPRQGNWLAAMQMSEERIQSKSTARNLSRDIKPACVLGPFLDGSFEISSGTSDCQGSDRELSRVRWRAGRTGLELGVESSRPSKGETAGVWPARCHLGVGCSEARAATCLWSPESINLAVTSAWNPVLLANRVRYDYNLLMGGVSAGRGGGQTCSQFPGEESHVHLFL